MATLAQIATVLSGIVSLVVIFGFIIDFLTSGAIRRRYRKWSGIYGLRQDHHVTQTFLKDLARSYNQLSERVCEEHDLRDDDIPHVDTARYERLLDDDDSLQSGDFLRGD